MATTVSPDGSSLTHTTASRGALHRRALHLHTLWRGARADLKKKEDELAGSAKRCETLDGDLASARQDVVEQRQNAAAAAETQQQLNFAWEQLEQVRAENEALRDRVRSAAAELENKTERIKDLKDDMAELRGDVDYGHLHGSALSKTAAGMQQLLGEARGRIRECEEKILMQEAANAQMRRDKMVLRTTVSGLEARLATTSDELTVNSAKAQTLETSCRRLKKTDMEAQLTVAELARLRRDNARFVRLLQSTKEYVTVSLLLLLLLLLLPLPLLLLPLLLHYH